MNDDPTASERARAELVTRLTRAQQTDAARFLTTLDRLASHARSHGRSGIDSILLRRLDAIVPQFDDAIGSQDVDHWLMTHGAQALTELGVTEFTVTALRDIMWWLEAAVTTACAVGRDAEPAKRPKLVALTQPAKLEALLDEPGVRAITPEQLLLPGNAGWVRFDPARRMVIRRVENPRRSIVTERKLPQHTYVFAHALGGAMVWAQAQPDAERRCQILSHGLADLLSNRAWLRPVDVIRRVREELSGVSGPPHTAHLMTMPLRSLMWSVHHGAIATFAAGLSQPNPESLS